MRAWFMLGALALGIIGWWGEQGRTGRTVRSGHDQGQVQTMDGPDPIPTPPIDPGH